MLDTVQLRYSYPSSERFSLNEVDLNIKKGSIVSLIGPNGSGKSTLLRAMARLLMPESGAVVLDGRDIHSMDSRSLSQLLAMLPQTHEHRLEMTVRELVELGRQPYHSWSKALQTEDKRIVEHALISTLLKRHEHRMLHTLSGGERQRAWIAMTIAQQPDILLLDEPTTYLDISHQLEVMELVQKLNRDTGLTVVMVLHDISQAARYSDRTVALHQGAIVADGSPREILTPSLFRDVFNIEADVVPHGNTILIAPKRRSTTPLSSEGANQMLIITNTIQVKEGYGAELAKRFETGRGVHEMPGFIRLEVWHGNSRDQEEVKICTVWENEESFKNWMSSESFREAHKGAGQTDFITGSYISKYSMASKLEGITTEVK